MELTAPSTRDARSGAGARRLPMYQLDAFAHEPFTGNPAAVCPLDAWLTDAALQAVAAENNLSETAFFKPSDRGDGAFDLRWFTPATEVDLCGHATLAAGVVALTKIVPDRDAVAFHTRKAGTLTVARAERGYRMDLPADAPAPAPDALDELARALGAQPVAAHRSRLYFLAEFTREQDVLTLAPDMRRLAQLERVGVIATAPAAGADERAPRNADFISRFFAPAAGVDEDPVTGSAHCALAPFWRERLGKERLLGWQASVRSGAVACEVERDRVVLEGAVAWFLEGVITLPTEQGAS